MRDRPILFSAPMVRAVLAGTKTQTRRPFKMFSPCMPEFNEDTGLWEVFNGDEAVAALRCPYGVPGDRLWVREAWQADPIIDDTWASTQWHGCKDSRIADLPERFHHPRFVNYRADWLHGDIMWRPSIHMSRWASRITLEVTGVRVERLQGISDADAIAEGIYSVQCNDLGTEVPYYRSLYGPRDLYRMLWESINGPGSWEANPWVWVVEFPRAATGQGGT